MPLINNSEIISQIKKQLPVLSRYKENEMIMEPFTRDFSLRFCWSSNALEGNTLSLEETISVIEYDEVQSGHTYSEYREAKSLYASVQKYLLPIQPRTISEAWLKQANGEIMSNVGEYRKKKVYIGTLTEAVHYPPDPEKVPELMQNLLGKWNRVYQEMTDTTAFPVLPDQVQDASSDKNDTYMENAIEMLATEHLEFESIHPFLDGNGRTGRMLLNQRIVNLGFLPIAITPSGAYRQAFRRAEKNGDISSMVHVICKSELEAIERMQCLIDKCYDESHLIT